MSKETEALENIRLELKKSFKFPLNLTPEYKTIYEALKRNEPMKRILHQSVNEKYPELLCPSCFVSNDPLNHYCPKCGQRLDWRDNK